MAEQNQDAKVGTMKIALDEDPKHPDGAFSVVIETSFGESLLMARSDSERNALMIALQNANEIYHGIAHVISQVNAGNPNGGTIDAINESVKH